ncbi:AraC family transcriptional regulator [Clostridia bacterium]|nr:AraC family transcriptional regulator [Clostridia bacterium]
MEYKLNVYHLFYQTAAKIDNDLSVLESGFKKCLPSHSFGPSVRDHYVIHCVTAGKGVLVKGAGRNAAARYTILPGQGFLICPNETTVYTADAETPWDYYWVSFTGAKCAEIINNCRSDSEHPVFKFEIDGPLHEYMHKLVTAPAAGPAVNHAKLGWLYLILSELITQKPQAKIPDIVKYAADYIEKNYTADISVQKLAEHCFINRSHLFRLFKEALGVSPREYILDLRLNKSCDYLRSSNYSVTHISEIMGFSDSSQYCKMFKKKFGMSPVAWLKRHAASVYE